MALISSFILKRQAAYTELHEEQAKKSKRVQSFEDEQNFNAELSVTLLCPYICYLVAEGL